jgi:hypothetical protein
MLQHCRAAGRQSAGLEVLSITSKKRESRAGDVNPPVRVRARAASVAAGAHEGRYRLIDIDRTPFRNAARRVYGALKVHGTLACARPSTANEKVRRPFLDSLVPYSLVPHSLVPDALAPAADGFSRHGSHRRCGKSGG